jgi:hypothetical protein
MYFSIIIFNVFLKTLKQELHFILDKSFLIQAPCRLFLYISMRETIGLYEGKHCGGIAI